jgi:hypothetical protein
MVSKKQPSTTLGRHGRVGKLTIKKETIKDLGVRRGTAAAVRGGRAISDYPATETSCAKNCQCIGGGGCA